MKFWSDAFLMIFNSRKPKASSYIINGTCAPEGSQPWIVQIQDRFSGNVYQHHCGGVIITEDHILTAAHCFKYV